MNTISISTDLMYLAVQQNLSYSANKLNQSMYRLATGSKINSAGDNAANLTLSSNIKTKISGVGVANENIKMSLSTLNNMESYYSQLTSQLQQLRGLAVQSANGTYTNLESNMINTSSVQLISGADQIASSANAGLTPTDQVSGFIDNINKISKTDAIKMGYDANHIIETASDFKTKITANMSGNFILVSDIDMSTLGTLSNSVIGGGFSGKLDGNGYSIDKLSIDTKGVSAAYSVGLFSSITGTAEIKNVAMKDLNIIAIKSSVVGGLVGSNSGGTIINAVVSGTVSGGSSVGGAVGSSTGGVIKDSSSSGSVTSGYGGKTGGFIGASANDSISNSNSKASVQGDAWSTGGFAGGVTGSNMSNLYSNGTVFGINGVGGLLGGSSNATISNSYSIGSVSGSVSVGGFLGNAAAGTTITHSYANGSVSGTSNIGGFAGQSSTAYVTNSYSSGLVTGSTFVGGFVGRQFSGGVDNTNYWDKETSGRLTSAGGGKGVTTAELEKIKAQGIWSNAGYKSEVGLLSVQMGTGDADTYTINNISIDLDLSEIDLSTSQKAKDSIDIIDQALSVISGKRTNVGIGVNILDSVSKMNNNQLTVLNQEYSTISDVDVAEEVAELVKQQILVQSNVFLLDQYRGSRRGLVLTLIGAS